MKAIISTEDYDAILVDIKFNFRQNVSSLDQKR